MARLCKLIFWLVLILPVSALAWDSGQNHTYTFSALTGGGNGALDSLSGASVGALDRAIVQTGTTFYFYENLDTGTTVGVESSPMRIVPDDLQAAGTGLTGTSTWALTALSGDTVEARALYVDATRWDNGAGKIDGEQIADDTIDDDSIDLTDVTLADFTNDANLPTESSITAWLTTYTNAASFTGATNFLTGTTNHATSHEAGGDWEMQLSDMASGTSDIMDKTGDAAMIANWNTAYGWGDHGAVGYLTGTTNHAALHAEGGDWELDIGNFASGTSRVFDKSTDKVTYIDGTAWRVLYTDASGNVSELALGANGTYLKSQGAAAVPAWDTPAGGGGGGSGTTTIQASDGTEAEASTIGDAPGGFFVDGRQGIETVASGNTVTIQADNVHSQVSAFVTGQGYLTAETDATALARLTDYTEANMISGVSIEDGTYDGDILIYDTGTGIWFAQPMSGDATITDGGVLSIADDAIDDAEMDYATVTLGDFTNDAGFLTTATDLSAPSGVTEQSAVTDFVCWTLLSPEEMISGNTPIPIWTVDAQQFPDGIMLVSVSLEVTSGATTFAVTYEEWDHSHQADIETVTSTNGAYTVVRRGDIDNRVIDAGDRIYIHPDTSKAYSIHGCIGYYPR